MRLILPTIFIIISGAIFFLFAKPIISEVKVLRDDVSTYEIALNNSTKLQDTMDSLVEMQSGISKDSKDKLFKLLPNTANNIKFVLEVEQIANLHNMPIKDISFTSVSSDSSGNNTENSGGDDSIIQGGESKILPYGVFPVEFKTMGSYDTFVLFLKELEHNLRLVDIKSVSFETPSTNVLSGAVNPVNPNVYEYSLKVETYWLK